MTTSRVVSVKFLGFLQRLAGGREASVEVEVSATVADLLASLGATYGPEFVGAVFRAPGEAHTHLRVFLNEEEARLTDRIVTGGETAHVAVLVVPGFEGGSR
jgi:molybdopterin converting factor small subunit